MQFQAAEDVEGPVIEKLRKLKAGNDFAQSLCDQWEARGSLSDKQWVWVHKLVEEGEDMAKKRVDMTRVLDFFHATGLKQPKVFIDTDKGKLALKVAGHQARVPGVVNILVDDAWIGRVHLDGTLFISRSGRDIVKQDWLIEQIDTFLEDPEAAARAYGKATNSCCFCAEPLSDERSIEAGYGPICAKRYGLPWGERVENDEEVS